MKRPRNSSTRQRRRRSNRKGLSHIIRGLVMEGMGIAVLVFLFLTIQQTPEIRKSNDSKILARTASTDSDLVLTSTIKTTEPAVQIAGHRASSWAEYTRRTQNQRIANSFQ